MVSIDSVIAPMKPAESHWARSWPRAKTCAMSGTATLTMVEAMIEATVPIITVASTRQRYDGPKRRSSAAREWTGSGEVHEARRIDPVDCRRALAGPPRRAGSQSSS